MSPVLLGAAGAIVLPALLDTGPETKDVGLTGSAPAELATALQAQGEAVDTTIRVHAYDTLADGEAAVRDGRPTYWSWMRGSWSGPSAPTNSSRPW